MGIASAQPILRTGTTITLNAPILRCHSAMPQHRAAPHSASSTRITGGAKQRRRDGATGAIAASTNAYDNLQDRDRAAGAGWVPAAIAIADVRPPRNYLHGVPWLDPHHRHRDAPPAQQEAGRSLKP